MPASDVSAIKAYATRFYPGDTILTTAPAQLEPVVKAQISKYYPRNETLVTLALPLASV